MANNKNLKPLNQRPQRERKEIARMGAEASNRAQANKRKLREAANILLTMPIDEKTSEELEQYISGDDCTYAMAIVVAQLKNALQGDTRAFIAIRDTIGEKPTETEQEVETDNNIVINIIPVTENDMREEEGYYG